jgi:hypothetical protein
MKKILLIIFFSLMAIAYAQASEQYISFNGDFANGTVLYSDQIYFPQVSITARDAYPIRNCAEYNLSSVTKKVCHTVNRTRTCVNVTTMRTRTRCTKLKSLCVNPSAFRTNQLSLTNFEYSTDGILWNTVPYTKLSLSDINLTFRVTIPPVCYPDYGINQAIRIKTLSIV